MEALMVFMFIILGIGVILFIAAFAGAFSGVSHVVILPPEVKVHQYTEDEFIALYNHCVHLRNIEAQKYPSIIQNQKIANFDTKLETILTDYQNPYQESDYNKLCQELLTFFDETTLKSINYGILK